MLALALFGGQSRMSASAELPRSVGMPQPLFDRAALARQAEQLSSSPDMVGPQLPDGADGADDGHTSLWGPAAMTVAGNAADTLSTLWALKHSGVHEGNPVLGQNPAVIAGLKAAVSIPQIYAERRLIDAGHPTIAKIMGASLAGLGAALAAHNISTVKGR